MPSMYTVREMTLVSSSSSETHEAMFMRSPDTNEVTSLRSPTRSQASKRIRTG